MKKIYSAAFVAAVVLGVGLFAAACDRGEKNEAPATAQNGDVTKPHAQTHCPVMDGEIKKEFFADVDGKRVYFCCPGCEADFYKDPRRYIKKLESQGVVLDKPDLKGMEKGER